MAATAPESAEAMAERLAGWIAGEIGVARGEVRALNLRRLAGGASRETWAFELEVKGGFEGAPRRSLVMRRDPPGRGGEGDRSLEFRVVRAAHAAGVPVPRPHFACSDPAVLGTSFYVMDFEAGETLPRRLLRDERYAGAREKMIGQLARIAARIHQMPLGRELDGLVGPPAGRTPAEAELARVAQGIAAMAAEPHPVLDLAERWLRARLPAKDARVALVHGDFRIGNVLFDEGGARAMLDWEICKRGDPVEDLGWLCTRAWRFGSDAPAGGIGTREELLAAYRAAGGGDVDPEHLLFWEAMGSYKVALVFIQQSWVYLSGKVPSLELASLGRRTAEAEEELVRLMEEAP